jgi:TetR/AcrR family transcriptional regulator, tetracycline repressor protein
MGFEKYYLTLLNWNCLCYTGANLKRKHRGGTMENDLGLSDKQQEIVEAALELLREKGFNELSMRDIAKKLGVKAPAIYWHFESKTVLVDYMAEYILRKEIGDFSPKENEQSWQNWLIYHISLLRKAMLSYPDGGRVVAGAHLFPAVTLAKLMEYTLVSLTGAGLDIRAARNIMVAAIRYTFGYVIEEQSDRPDRLLTSPRHAIGKALMEAANIGDTEDDIFLSGLELIIIGGSETARQKQDNL